MEGEGFGSWGVVEEGDDAGIVFACEQGGAESLKGKVGVWIDSQGLLPLRVGFATVS